MTPCFASDAFSSTQTTAIETIVHHYLVENPEILVESFQTLKSREASKKQKKTDNATVQYSKALVNNRNSPVLGNPNGDVSVVEFLDYRCSHCQEMGAVIDGLIKHDPKLRVVIKELPIFGNVSQYLAKFALASSKQAKFEAIHRAFLNNHDNLDEARAKELATAQGIDIKKLENDMQNISLDEQLSSNLELAKKLHIEGTPAFIIKSHKNEKTAFIPGAVTQSNLQDIIGQLRSDRQP